MWRLPKVMKRRLPASEQKEFGANSFTERQITFLFSEAAQDPIPPF